MSLGVVTVASDAYAHNLPAWAQSVAALVTPPDRVVIACQSDPGPLAVEYTTTTIGPDVSFADWFNAAIGACDTDWVAWIGVDDTYRPHALDGIERDDADVVAFGFQFDTGQVWMPGDVTAEQVRRIDGNPVPCGSPFRRSLWQACPLNPLLDPFSDWGLWVGFAHLNARFASTGRIDVDYAYAGHTYPPIEPTRSLLCDWAQSL